tara:strand:- start:611 stop:1597 length:987 start_codon:yes stop_codon:yes gene_type:complete
MRNKNDKILVTGAMGFIGSHLTETLVQLGYDVIAFDRYNSNNHWGFLENSKYKSDIEFILGDIRDYDSVSKVVNKCDVIMHLAALIGIPYSYISPSAYIKTNIEGTYNILEAAKIKNKNQILITSTSEIYGSAQYNPIDENHPVVGQSPYSASKISADQLSISYHRSFDLPIKIVRPFNTYGPRQSDRAIIPTIISQLLSVSDALDLGSLTPTRDFTYVSDTCNGFIEILGSEKFFGEVVNIGSNKEISIAQLLEKISKIMNVYKKPRTIKERVRPANSEVSRLICDNGKLVSSTPWKINVDFDEGLKKTIQWVKKNKSYFKSGIYNV